jgi:hypothetical protein
MPLGTFRLLIHRSFLTLVNLLKPFRRMSIVLGGYALQEVVCQDLVLFLALADGSENGEGDKLFIAEVTSSRCRI